MIILFYFNGYFKVYQNEMYMIILKENKIQIMKSNTFQQYDNFKDNIFTI